MAETEHEHSLTIQSLKQKMVDMRNEHIQQLEKGATQKMDRAVSVTQQQVESAVPTTPLPPATEESLRLQYEFTLQNIRGAATTLSSMSHSDLPIELASL